MLDVMNFEEIALFIFFHVKVYITLDIQPTQAMQLRSSCLTFLHDSILHYIVALRISVTQYNLSYG